MIRFEARHGGSVALFCNVDTKTRFLLLLKLNVTCLVPCSPSEHANMHAYALVDPSTWSVSFSARFPVSPDLLHRIFHRTSSLSSTSHPTAFPGVPLGHIKSRTGEPSYQTYSFLTSSFRPGVYDSQIPFGLPPIPSPSADSSMPSKTLLTMP